MLLGATNGVFSVTLSSLAMARTAADERGRVGALVGGVSSGTQILAFAVGGALAGVVHAARDLRQRPAHSVILAPLALGPGLVRRAVATVTSASPAATPVPA